MRILFLPPPSVIPAFGSEAKARRGEGWGGGDLEWRTRRSVQAPVAPNPQLCPPPGIPGEEEIQWGGLSMDRIISYSTSEASFGYGSVLPVLAKPSWK